MRYLTEAQKKNLEDNGFLILKGVFTPEEVENAKLMATKFCSINDYKRSPMGDAMSLDGAAEFLLEDRFVNIAKDVLGEEVVYFGDSALHCKPNNRIFHKDARSDNWDPSNSEYPIYRMGIFFQDHSQHSGGIKFRTGSHKRIIYHPKPIRTFMSSCVKVLLGKLKPKALFNNGAIVNAKSEVGDVVIWNLRTDHSGGAVILKDDPDKAMLPSKDEKVAAADKLPEHETRMAIFCAFCAPHEASEAYILGKVNNKAYQDHWMNASYDQPHIQKLAKEKNITLDFRGIEKYRKVSEV